MEHQLANLTSWVQTAISNKNKAPEGRINSTDNSTAGCMVTVGSTVFVGECLSAKSSKFSYNTHFCTT